MRHFLVMALLAAFIGVVFGAVSHGTRGERVRYGARVFVEFMGVGLALAWLLYWLPP